MTSGLLGELWEGLVAPRCYGAEERTDAVWLWLEDIRGVPGPELAPAQIEAAVRRFGAFNGAYLTGRSPPDAPWLARGLRRAQTAEAAAGVTRLAAMGGHPLVEAGWPAGLDGAVLRVWEPRATFLDALDVLPQTLADGDVHEACSRGPGEPARRAALSTGPGWGSAQINPHRCPAAFRAPP